MGGGNLFKTHCSSENSRCYAIKRFLCSSCPHRITKANDKNYRQETFIRHSTAINKTDERPQRNRKGNNYFQEQSHFPENNKDPSYFKATFKKPNAV